MHLFKIFKIDSRISPILGILGEEAGERRLHVETALERQLINN